MKKLSNIDGQCPYCKSDNVDWGQSRPDGDSMYYECNCENCGKHFHCFYDLVFAGMWGNDKNKK